MIRIIRLLILIQLVFGFFACHPDPPDCINPPCNPNPVDTSKKGDTNIVWQYNADTLRNSCISMTPILYKNTVLFSRRGTDIADGFLMFDKKNGALLNTYFDPTSQNWKTGEIYQYNNLCAITDWYEIYFLDLSTNQFLHKINLRNLGYDGRPRIGGNEEWLYIPV